jgi:hypothetical protein
MYWPSHYQRSGLTYSGDDFSYVAHATVIVFYQWPDYSLEYFEVGDNVPAHSVGPALLALPFAWAGSLVDRALDAPIVTERTRESLYMSWTVFGFIISSSVYFWLSCLLLYGAARFVYSARTSATAVVCLVLMQGVPLYAYRRPVFPHVGELFLQSVLVCLLVWSRHRPIPSILSLRWAPVVGLVCGLLVLVRPNDAILACLWPILLFGDFRQWRWPLIGWRQVTAAAGVAIVLVGVFRFLPNMINEAGVVGVGTYESDALGRVFGIRPLGYYSKRLAHIFAGRDWGLLWTAPYLVVGTAVIASRKAPMRRECLLLASALLVNVWIVLQWPSQASWYGYRYLVFAAIPVLLLPMACFVDWIRLRLGRGAIPVLLAIGVFPLVSMLSFGIAPNLGLAIRPNIAGWSNPDFQVQAWGFLLASPFQYAEAVLREGVGYIFGVIQGLWGLLFPSVAIGNESPREVNLPLLCRSIVIWILPLLLHLAAWRSGLLRRLLPKPRGPPSSDSYCNQEGEE